MSYTVEDTGKIVFEEEDQQQLDILGNEDSRCTLLVSTLATHYPECTIRVW